MTKAQSLIKAARAGQTAYCYRCCALATELETLITEVSSQHKQIERLEWLLMKEGYVAVRNFSVSGWWC